MKKSRLWGTRHDLGSQAPPGLLWSPKHCAFPIPNSDFQICLQTGLPEAVEFCLYFKKLYFSSTYLRHTVKNVFIEAKYIYAIEKAIHC